MITYDEFVEKYKDHFRSDFGVQVYVGPAWLNLVDRAFSGFLSWASSETQEDGTKKLLPSNRHFVIHQIKEKFGGIRVYLSPTDDAPDKHALGHKLDGLVCALEGICNSHCDHCGAPHKATGINGYITPTCPICLRALELKRQAELREAAAKRLIEKGSVSG